MTKYSYLIFTTKRNLSEADHTRVLNTYGEQGFRLMKEEKHGVGGGTTYIMERAFETQKVTVDSQRSPITNLRPHELLIVPSKYIYEVTEVLMKGLEAQGSDLPLEVKKLLIAWISLNRADLEKKHHEEWEELKK